MIIISLKIPLFLIRLKQAEIYLKKKFLKIFKILNIY